MEGLLNKTVTRTDAVGTVSNAYDAVGNLTSVTDERGKTTTYSYFQGAWPNTTLDPVGKRVVHAYDAAGRLIRTGAGSTGYDDRTEYTFSPTTGLLAKVRAYAGAAYHDVDYTYDGAARLTKAGDSPLWRGFLTTPQQEAPTPQTCQAFLTTTTVSL